MTTKIKKFFTKRNSQYWPEFTNQLHNYFDMPKRPDYDKITEADKFLLDMRLAFCPDKECIYGTIYQALQPLNVIARKVGYKKELPDTDNRLTRAMISGIILNEKPPTAIRGEIKIEKSIKKTLKNPVILDSSVCLQDALFWNLIWYVLESTDFFRKSVTKSGETQIEANIEQFFKLFNNLTWQLNEKEKIALLRKYS